MGWTGTDPVKWADEQKQRLHDIGRTAADKMLGEMGTSILNGGFVNIRTGNLARSATAQVGMQVTISEAEEFTGPDDAAVQTWDLTSVLYLGWQAAYARRVNYGFTGEDSLGRTYNQSGSGFAESISANWSKYVDQAVREVTGPG